MNLAEIPLFSMLRGRLGYLSERQKVIAQNVANTDTARYVSEDLKPYSFDARVQMQRATKLSQDCDLMLAIGSSLVVWPAAGFPLLAKRCGAKLVIINIQPTDQDDQADLVIRFDIGETLGPFVGN